MNPDTFFFVRMIRFLRPEKILSDENFDNKIFDILPDNTYKYIKVYMRQVADGKVT